MRTLTSSLRTMHLVETLAVALYQGPQPVLRRRNAALYQAFVSYEETEIKHRALFLEGLRTHHATPVFLAGALAASVGVFAYVVCLLCGIKALLHFEIVVERFAIWHYGKILRRPLPAPWQATVREVQQDERYHLQQLQHWLT